jgi:hypothetical protein
MTTIYAVTRHEGGDHGPAGVLSLWADRDAAEAEVGRLVGLGSPTWWFGVWEWPVGVPADEELNCQ